MLNTAEAMRAFGADVLRDGDGAWRVWGRGVGGLAEPDGRARFRQLRHRLAAGDGRGGDDADHGGVHRRRSLRRRPMKRVLEPLTLFGANTRRARAG